MPYNAKKAKTSRERLINAMIDGTFEPQAPLRGTQRHTSGFGWRRHPVTGQRKFHTGVDLAAPEGTPVYATEQGYLSANYANDPALGRAVFLEHPGGYQTRYEHLDRMSPQALKGGWFRKGDLLGYSGSTGRSTGPHLHYGTYRNKKPVKPTGV